MYFGLDFGDCFVFGCLCWFYCCFIDLLFALIVGVFYLVGCLYCVYLGLRFVFGFII